MAAISSTNQEPPSQTITDTVPVVASLGSDNTEDGDGVDIIVSVPAHRPVSRNSRISSGTGRRGGVSVAVAAAPQPLPTSILSRGQRLTLGILVLILVDVIWVASSELTEYIFHDEKYSKPFFSTYLKTSMFIIFLLGFIFHSPWHERCRKEAVHTSPYTLISNDPESGTTGIDSDEAIDDEMITATVPAALSLPIYIPIHTDPTVSSNNDDNSSSSGIEEVEADVQKTNSQTVKVVRFNKLAEVRQLSDSDGLEAIFARLSYTASLQAEQMAFRMANRLGLQQTAMLSLQFCIVWFLANYTYQVALANTEVGIVNVLSSSSSLFTLVLASIFPSVIATDKFTLSKFCAVLISMIGVITVSFSDMNMEPNATVPLGAIFALLSALFYAMYLVFLRKKVDHEDKLDIPMFFGFVGAFNLILLWPIFFVLHYTNIEHFDWPTRRQWLFLLVNGFIGTVFSEVLWLWGSFLTSTLIATLAITLTIPMSMLADIFIKGVHYSTLFYMGTLPMLIAFFSVTLLTQVDDWDPVQDLFVNVCKWFSGIFGASNPQYTRVLVHDYDPTSSALPANGNTVIGINNCDDEEEDEDEYEDNRLEQENQLNSASTSS